MNKRLSENFWLSEFTRSADINIVPTDQQKYCLNILANEILQPIRDKFGPVVITSGLRNKDSYEKLLEEGYPASKMSDHFAWSSINPKGTGAADFYCSDKNMMLCAGGGSMGYVFDWIITNLYYKCRQMIFYPDMNVIHVSNHFNSIFKMSDTIAKENKVLIKRKGQPFISYLIN